VALPRLFKQGDSLLFLRCTSSHTAAEEIITDDGGLATMVGSGFSASAAGDYCSVYMAL
jgi:hypothetical protein